MTPLRLLGLVFTALVCIRFIVDWRRGDLKEDWSIFEGFRIGSVAAAIGGGIVTLTGVVTVFALLYSAAPRVFGWSWLMLLARPEEKDEAATNLLASGLEIPVFAYMFVLVLAAIMPGVALTEERMFREGTENWWQAIPRSVAFGLVHMVVGVPLAAGLALGVGGLYLSAVYMRSGLKRAAAFHAIYNWVILSLLLISMAVSDAVRILQST